MSDIRGKIDRLLEKLDELDFHGEISLDTPLAPMTYYKVGGNASVFIEVGGTVDLVSLKNTIDGLSIPWMLIGGGANLLVSDSGFKGVIIKLAGSFSEIIVDEDKIKIRSGSAVPLLSLVREGSRIGMAGIERLAGIPGSVGGAVYMNAGTFGDYIGGLIESIDILTENNTVTTLKNPDCEFTYRTSRFQKTTEIILGCSVKSEKGDPGKINIEIERRIARRKDTQPIEIPSCGCVFRNPDGCRSAGFFIQEAGLKGTKKGGAEISGKHANFIVNTGHATASDILFLMALARKKVRDLSGINLDPEVRLVGFDKPLEAILDAIEKEEKF
ncbi:MAG: UDP-N-acetylmuramate dehydrogenase [bacterium]|nr:UDP-N-acetylmuramate dehydrogenase [bacterium]